MSDTRNKLQYGKNWKILDLVLDLNYFCFSNPTHSPKHQTLSPNNQFSRRIWYAEYYSVHAHGVKSEISLDTGITKGYLLTWSWGDIVT